MATLTGQPIDQSYSGLLKTLDNAALQSAGFPQITDGVGNNSMLKMSQTELQLGSNINTQYFKQFANGGGSTELKDVLVRMEDATASQYFQLDAVNAGMGAGSNYFLSTAAGSSVVGPLDLSGATVTGLPGGAAGLVAGTGTDSMKNADSLTTTGATASGTNTIALGKGAIATSEDNIAIGTTADSGGDTSFARRNIAIGQDSTANNEKDVAIGTNARATGARSTSIGDNSQASGSRAVAVGASSQATAFSSACIGAFSSASGEGSVVLGGYNSSATAVDSIAVGKEADALSTEAMALGRLAQATATGAVALGANVTGAIAETVSAKALELQTNSTPTAGGIIMSDAAGTDRRINITMSGGLQIDSTPVGGGGGAAGLVAGTGADAMKSADALSTTANLASGANAIAIGNGNTADVTDSIAIGDSNNNTGQGNTIMIGKNWAQTFGTRGVFIGSNASTESIGQDDVIAIGSITKADCAGGIAIGTNTTVEGASAGYGIAVGYGAKAGLNGATQKCIALGKSALASASGAIAIGESVTAATVDTLSTKALELQTNSTPTAGGIIMSDAGGTDRRINIDASGNLQVDSVSLAPAPVFKLPRVGGLNQASGCDVIQSSVLIPANTMQAGDIWQLSGADSASGSTGFVYSAFWISTTGTVGNSATEEVNIGQQESGSTQWSRGYQKNLYIGTQDGTGIGTELVCSGCSQDATQSESGGMQTFTPDWTNDLYLVARVCVDNAGATYVNHGATLRKIN